MVMLLPVLSHRSVRFGPLDAALLFVLLACCVGSRGGHGEQTPGRYYMWCGARYMTFSCAFQRLLLFRFGYIFPAWGSHVSRLEAGFYLLRFGCSARSRAMACVEPRLTSALLPQ